MYEILCFGDSNTWGYNPATGERFPRDVRWTGVLQAELGAGYHVIEEGLNGRTTVWEDPVEGDKMGRRHLLPCLESQAPLDLVILMLGTNDLKMRYSAPPVDIARGAGVLLDIVASSAAGSRAKAPPVLLMAPVPLGTLTEFAQMFQGGPEKSRMLGPLYAALAKERGCAFFDAGSVGRCSEKDGLHYDAPVHRALGQAVAREVKKILKA
ncbi:MAG TPA: SGNH/GDSL hydrolase family protein [Spirochaetia bacterium]|nr:SGNH/GDSL hydrolase family protein [Spirochaetia bacterium]